ncbi:hypothetical protein A4D02_16125 [Niastella koreensis]|uniref:Outer membrane protein beta-barrel domain-containing protein n=2 Tax=Niastella koreensis TaxID=354356 RepID=G8TN60_NIAKG|nr:hypothetical protein [Niastella koreensis]AEV97745.1 hypothetical protein Niako_1374 [Niastella koreensis GR20-10]OQP40439.1 hypothetical protein A4D02_16125 [Niastella koreensis]
MIKQVEYLLLRSSMERIFISGYMAELRLLMCLSGIMIILKKIAITLLVAVVLCPVAGFTQEQKFQPKHSLAINLGHEHSFHGIETDGSSKTIILPYWGFDYNFQFARKFAVGMHLDYINEEFEIEKNLESGFQEVKRTRPLAPAVMGFYKPTERWSFGLGAGIEYSKEASYFLNRVAVEYGVEIRNGWEVFGVFQYDIRWQAYDTWTIGLGIGKTIGNKKQ